MPSQSSVDLDSCPNRRYDAAADALGSAHARPPAVHVGTSWPSALAWWRRSAAKLAQTRFVHSSADTPSEANSGSGSHAKELSAVVGRIIDQLSLSAWIPGLALVGGIALLVALQGSASGGRPNLDIAFTKLADISLGGALALLGAVMLSTVVAQAFEFEMIKLLEGYWGAGRLPSWLRARRTDKHASRLHALRQQKKRLEKAALKRSIPRMAPADPELTREVKKTWRAQRAAATPLTTPSDAATYLLANWRRAAVPGDLRALEACEGAIRWYPSEHRLLPTALGNTLRSSEDRMKLSDGGDLEGFVLRNYGTIPERLLGQLSAFRTRLNMYCSMVLVCVALAIVAVPLTIQFDAGHYATVVLSFVAFAALALVSYRAAIASARGYVAALLSSDEEVTKTLAASALARGGHEGGPDKDQAT